MSTTTIAFTLGEPRFAGALAVFPVFGTVPRLTYRGLAQAISAGAVVTEVDEHGNVNLVVINNRTDLPLLVYEGEQVHGARQNRTFDAHVLIPAGASMKVPVSCVEQGRWDPGRRSDPFASAPQAADPALRAVKRRRANLRFASGAAAAPDQREVWHEVSERLEDYCAESPSAALADVYTHVRDDLDVMAKELSADESEAAETRIDLDDQQTPRQPARVSALPGQLGAVVEISGRPVALDLVSRPEVFADLLPRLADGYALQALRAETAGPNPAAARGFLEAVIEATRRKLPTPGMGQTFSVTQRGVHGSGLTVKSELIALAAFPGNDPSETAPPQAA